CLLIYALVRQLASSWAPAPASLAAFFSAALFASYPLHCQGVSWVVGRVDIAFCLYYLLSLFLVALSRQTGTSLCIAGSIAGFWLGITVKEMAIGLAVMAAAMGFFFTAGGGMKDRVKSAFLLSWPLWLCTGIYFVLRYLTLGTLTGGYTGGIGATQTSA